MILEMVHIASLVHDDIMDGADIRRGLPTAAAKWGNSLSVLLGDSLFAYALELATEFDETNICRSIAKASRDVCCGEIFQTQRRFDLNLSVADYNRMIEMKTAALLPPPRNSARRSITRDPKSGGRSQATAGASAPHARSTTTPSS